MIAVSADWDGYLDWPGARQVFCLRRHIVRVRTGAVLREETVYGVTSLDATRGTPEQLLALVRGQWTIENKSHWVRDVTFDEDRCQVRTPNIPQVLATLRNLVVGLLRHRGERTVADARRTCSADPTVALHLLSTTKEN